MDKAVDPIDLTLPGAEAVVFAARHAAHLVQEQGWSSYLRHRYRSACGFRGNRAIFKEFSLSGMLNDSIGLKNE